MKHLLAFLFAAGALAQTSSPPPAASSGASSRPASATSFFRPRDFGAICDGGSHPAGASGYSTLSTLQAKYPFASALTNQMDWLGGQAAINAAITTGGGRVLYTGGSTCVDDRPLVVPFSVDFFVPNGPSLSIEGDGMNTTFITPVADFGANSGLLSCGPPAASWSDHRNAGSGRYAQLGACFGLISNITFKNRLITDFAYGSAPAISGVPVQMDGILWGARMALYRVAVEGFRAGINVVGDHTKWDQVYAQNNMYGIYMAPASKWMQGDLVWDNCWFTNNMVAGVFISKDTYLNVHQSGELYLGGQPYAFLGEAGTADNYGQPFAGGPVPLIVNSTLQFLQAEWIGNGLIWDDNKTVSDGTVYGGAKNTRDLTNVSIRMLYTSWDAHHADTKGGRGAKAWIGVNTINGFTIDNILPGSLSGNGTGQVAGIHCYDMSYSGGPFILRGDIEGMITTYKNLEFIHAPPVPNAHSVVLVAPRWTGGITYFQSAVSSLAAGSLIEAATFAGGVLAAGKNPVLGVNMQPWTSSPNNKYTIYAESGRMVPVNLAGTVANGGRLKATAGGNATAATGTGTEYLIGFAVSSSASTAYTSLRLY